MTGQISMDDRFHSFSPDDSDAESVEPEQTFPKPSSSNVSGIKLILPSLKSLQAAKAPKKSKAAKTYTGHQDAASQEKKVARPIKLKPLKEVLSKLIAQIKKYWLPFLPDILSDEMFPGRMTMRSS